MDEPCAGEHGIYGFCLNEYKQTNFICIKKKRNKTLLFFFSQEEKRNINNEHLDIVNILRDGVH